MSLRAEWFDDAIEDLARLPDWRLAVAVDEAVERYARDGIGFVLQVLIRNGPDEYRLLIPRMRTYVRIRRGATALYVERIIFRP